MGCEAKRPITRGLFSWHSDVMQEDGRTELLKVMKSQGLSELYQHVSSDADPQELESFVAALADAEVRTYLLAGERAWGLDASGEELCEEVERAAGISGCTGVLLDVETYLTDEWEADPDACMATFVAAMSQANALAHERGIELLVCLPFYLDSFESELAELVEQGCTGLVVMNYQRHGESDHLALEASLCEKAGVRLINAYTVQAVGDDGLIESNTYRDEGLDALHASEQQLLADYPTVELSFAIHDYRSLRAMLGE